MPETRRNILHLSLPEAYFEMEIWMACGSECGEVINENSWVMSHLWNTKKGHIHGLVTVPKKLQSTRVRILMEDALWIQRLRMKFESSANL
jgi:hypothetical protein